MCRTKGERRPNVITLRDPSKYRPGTLPYRVDTLRGQILGVVVVSSFVWNIMCIDNTWLS